MRVTIMFLLHFLLIKDNYVVFDLAIFWLTQIKVQHFLSLLKQYSYTEISNFPDDFMILYL